MKVPVPDEAWLAVYEVTDGLGPEKAAVVAAAPHIVADAYRKIGLEFTTDGRIILDPRRLAEAAATVDHEFVGVIFPPGETTDIARSVLYHFLQEPSDD